MVNGRVQITIVIDLLLHALDLSVANSNTVRVGVGVICANSQLNLGVTAIIGCFRGEIFVTVLPTVMVHESHHLGIGETLAVVNWGHIRLTWGALVVCTVPVLVWLQGIAHVVSLDEAGASGLVERSSEAARCGSHHTLAGVWVASPGASFSLRCVHLIRARYGIRAGA